MLMNDFIQISRKVFTQFCTDGNTFYLQCFQAYRKGSNYIALINNDTASITSFACAAKKSKAKSTVSICTEQGSLSN